MADVTTPKPVRHCYRCGRRIDKTKDSCWYCGAPLQRHIRPPRNCQFCGSSVPHDAVKCRHCGEFLDGRAQPPAAAGPQQVVYVIDKDLLRATADHRLLAGRPVPPEIARRLTDGTVRAIERNEPRLIDVPGVKALPAPADDVIEAEVIPAAGEPRRLPGASTDLAAPGDVRRGGGGGEMPVRRDETPQSMAARFGLVLGRALAGLGRWLVRTAPGRTKPESDTLEAQTEDRYRICENCSAEILADDNYCYHCGAQYHRTAADSHRRRPDQPSNLGLYMLIILLVAVLAVLKILALPAVPALTYPIIAGVTGLLCVVAFFSRRTFLNQVFTLVLTLAALAAYYL